jgi:dTDP-4-dehydrorhamnose reductase
MARLLVTGASGMTGSEVASRATGRGWEVLALSHTDLDISDADAVDRTMRELRPDVVVNTAAYTAVDRAESEPDRAARVNDLGAGNVARGAAAASAGIVHVSTDYVFAGDAHTPYLPDDFVAPRSVYGRTKLAGEVAVREANDDHCIVRTSWVFGRTGSNFVSTMLRLATERQEIRVVADQQGRPTYAGDLADALLEVADQLRTSRTTRGTYHFANSGETTWFDFARAIFEIRPAPELRLIPISSVDYPTPARRPRFSVLDTASFTAQFGISPRPWQEPLREMLSVS